MKMGKEEEEKHKHHRKPRSIGGDNSKRNISLIKAGKHNAWHRLFKNFDVHKIAEVINEKYLDPDYELIVHYKGGHYESTLGS